MGEASGLGASSAAWRMHSQDVLIPGKGALRDYRRLLEADRMSSRGVVQKLILRVSRVCLISCMLIEPHTHPLFGYQASSTAVDMLFPYSFFHDAGFPVLPQH